MQLYDLAGAESQRRFSPYCWRTKLALMHKGLPFDRETSVLAFRKALEPLHSLLTAQAYIGGNSPAYADYIVFGRFQWARCTSPFRLLLEEDAVWAWRDRLLRAFDGFALKALGYPV